MVEWQSHACHCPSPPEPRPHLFKRVRVLSLSGKRSILQKSVQVGQQYGFTCVTVHFLTAATCTSACVLNRVKQGFPLTMPIRLCHPSLRACLWVCLLVCLAACNGQGDRSSEPRNRDAQTVLIQPVVWRFQSTRLEAVGTSRAAQSVTLYSKTAGLVDAVAFIPGEQVEKGQPLLRLDARDQQLAVEAARLDLAEAQRLFSRYRRSEDAGAVTVSALEEAESAMLRTKVALSRAEVALQDRTVLAPFAGHVGLNLVDPGAFIDTGTPLTTLDDRSHLLITFSLPEVYYPQVQAGQPLSLTGWNHGSSAFTAEIVEVDSRIDPQTRAFSIRARADNPQDTLRPGMSFRVQLDLVGGRYPQVPEVALQWGGDGAFVWVAEQGKARRVPATVVLRQQGSVLINAELAEGTPVVVEGLQNLREGAAIEQLSEQPAADPL